VLNSRQVSDGTTEDYNKVSIDVWLNLEALTSHRNQGGVQAWGKSPDKFRVLIEVLEKAKKRDKAK
jgi:hypothetical protein